MNAQHLLARLRGATGSATFMYMLALAMGGAAVVLTVFLPPVERGSLVATTASATIGLAVGGLSLETFLLAQGRPWLERTASLESLGIYLSTLPLSAGLAWVFAWYSDEGSPAAAALGGTILAAGTIPAAAGLSDGRFLQVYRTRAIFAAAVPALYLVLAIASIRDPDAWLVCWFLAQGVLAVMMWVGYGGLLLRSARRFVTFSKSSLIRLLVTHIGAVALILALRFDQLALSRFSGPAALAIYSLAIAATEFTQAGAVVSAQRILGAEGPGAARQVTRALRNSVGFATVLSALVVAGLVVIGLLAGEYRPAALVGLALFPRSVFLVAGRILSARLVGLNGEAAAAVIAFATSALAVVAYVLVVPRYGAVGAAITAGALFAIHTFVTYAGVRRRSRTQPAGQPTENGVREFV